MEEIHAVTRTDNGYNVCVGGVKCKVYRINVLVGRLVDLFPQHSVNYPNVQLEVKCWDAQSQQKLYTWWKPASLWMCIKAALLSPWIQNCKSSNGWGVHDCLAYLTWMLWITVDDMPPNQINSKPNTQIKPHLNEMWKLKWFVWFDQTTLR